ncbi:MAG: hypothetical protein JJV98_02505 [Desulfosarcina sp.]|nr:hypothetical protein [Desulfobacterales bacterium]
MSYFRQLAFKTLKRALFTLAGLLLVSGAGRAASDQLPASIDNGMGYLYEFTDPDTTGSFETRRIAAVMDYMKSVLGQNPAPQAEILLSYLQAPEP